MAEQRNPLGAGSECVFVGDWSVTVGPYGVEVAKAGTALPRAPLRQRSVGVLPEPFPDLLGRQDEVGVALAALGGHELLEVYGEFGVGKTSLLRHLAHRAVTAFPDLPVVYVAAAGQTLGDLLQTLFTLLYRSDVPRKPAHAQLRHELRRAQAVLLLDDVELGSEDLAELLRAVPDCRVVFTSHRRRVVTEGRSLGLAGLDEQAGGQLLAQALGRGLRDGEYADARQLWNLLAGHPLRLLQAAAVVREGDRTLPELVSALGAGDPVEVLQQMCVAGLSAQQRRVVAVLAMTGGMLLPVSLVKAMSQVADLGAELRKLRDRGVVEQRRDRYGLPVGSLGPPRRLIGPGLDRPLALRSLAAWLEDPATRPEDLLSVSGAVLTLLEVACESGESETVIRLVRAVEPVLILSGRWQAWRYALDQGVQAARALQRVADEAHFLHQAGSSDLALDDPDTALRVLDEALKLRKAHDTRAATAVTRRNRDLAAQIVATASAIRSVQEDRHSRDGLKKWVSRVSAVLGGFALIALAVQTVANMVENAVAGSVPPPPTVIVSPDQTLTNLPAISPPPVSAPPPAPPEPPKLSQPSRGQPPKTPIYTVPTKQKHTETPEGNPCKDEEKRRTDKDEKPRKDDDRCKDKDPDPCKGDDCKPCKNDDNHCKDKNPDPCKDKDHKNEHRENKPCEDKHTKEPCKDEHRQDKPCKDKDPHPKRTEIEQPKPEHTKIEQPKPERTKIERPKPEHTKIERPKPERTKIERPKPEHTESKRSKTKTADSGPTSR
ncbi:MAG: AAA family ATPase [Egibacteraceae bacterium]